MRTSAALPTKGSKMTATNSLEMPPPLSVDKEGSAEGVGTGLESCATTYSVMPSMEETSHSAVNP